MKAKIQITFEVNTDNTTWEDYKGSNGPLNIAEDFVLGLANKKDLAADGVVMTDPTFVVVTD
jgi:hypothetical protein